ncbi:MAG TPA: DUF333 domain-containing protein [Candidatus Bipolaricaulota bacterium]|nr:DUF333 domain-containing protein [Candidatus Bipolaricaulota bacterium]
MKKIILIIASVVIVAGGGFLVYYLWSYIADNDLDLFEKMKIEGKISDFDECADAGYAIMESYPRQCRTEDGRLFVEEINEDDNNLNAVGNNAGLANPASVYCEDNGGKLEIRTLANGQAGFCLFDDNSECSEWEYFRGECAPGDNFCKDTCGDGECQEVVCESLDCACAETSKSCSIDCK